MQVATNGLFLTEQMMRWSFALSLAFQNSNKTMNEDVRTDSTIAMQYCTSSVCTQLSQGKHLLIRLPNDGESVGLLFNVS